MKIESIHLKNFKAFKDVEIKNIIERLLDIVDEAKAAEFNLLDSWGETDSTIIALEQLTEIAQQAIERFFPNFYSPNSDC